MFVPPPLMWSIRLPTSRFSMTRSSRNSAISGSESIDALMTCKSPIVPKSCAEASRNDYDRSPSAGKDSETTHALALRTHGESSTSKSFVIAPEFCYWSLPVPWGVALREKSQNAWKPPTYGWGEATALVTRAPLHQQPRRFSHHRDRRLGRRP